jgi:hypothetical protein
MAGGIVYRSTGRLLTEAASPLETAARRVGRGEQIEAKRPECSNPQTWGCGRDLRREPRRLGARGYRRVPRAGGGAFGDGSGVNFLGASLNFASAEHKGSRRGAGGNLSSSTRRRICRRHCGEFVVGEIDCRHGESLISGRSRCCSVRSWSDCKDCSWYHSRSGPPVRRD